MTDISYRRNNLGSFIWNSAYAGLSSTQAAIILFFSARAISLRDCGIITIGFTIANLLMVVAIYGMRNFQVTDASEKYSFTDYFLCRIVTVVCTVVFAAAFLIYMGVIGRYSADKALLIFEIILMKMVDAFENVYVGRFQQKGFLNIGARIATIRLVITIGTVCLFVVIFRTAWIAFLMGVVISIVSDFILISRMCRYADLGLCLSTESKENVKVLLSMGVILCVGSTLLNYVGNAPKYLVDIFLSDEEMQAKIGYVMLPIFVITLLNNFIMQPTVKTLGDVWASGDRNRFRRMIFRHVIILSGLSVAVLALGIWIGLPVIEILYKVDLSEFKDTFILLFAGGTLYTLSAYFAVLLITVRRQNLISLGCVAAILFFILFGKTVLSNMGAAGLGILYIAANAMLLGVFVIGLFLKVSDKVR